MGNYDNCLKVDEFIKCIEELKTFYEFECGLNECLERFAVDGYLYFPDVITTTIKVLEKMFQDEDGWIDYYCWELEFGKRWQPGMISSEGKDVPLETPENLYALLIAERMVKEGNE